MTAPVVIVTGGAGYIGSHACKALARAGYLPVAYDNLSVGHRRNVRWGPLEVGDILDLWRLQEVVSTNRPVAVMHFAALALVGESVVEPARYWRSNVTATVNLLDVCRMHGVKNVVLSSTCAVYGIPPRVPITEESPKAPVNPYGASKLAAERAVEDYRSAYGLRAATLRYFNAAGADLDGELGEDRAVETHLIPLALDAALGRRPALRILGNDYPTPDGTAIRDYVHVADLADAHVRALRLLEGGTERIVANLGTGRGHSVLDIVRTIGRISGCRVPCEITDRRPGDPPELVADPSAAREALGLDPSAWNSLDGIIQTAWNWRSSGRDIAANGA